GGPEPLPAGWGTLHPRLRPRYHRAEAVQRPGPVGRRVLAGRHDHGGSRRPDRPGESGDRADVRLRAGGAPRPAPGDPGARAIPRPAPRAVLAIHRGAAAAIHEPGGRPLWLTQGWEPVPRRYRPAF